MVVKNSYRVTLRGKRQLTLPSEVSEGLGLAPGDSVEIRLEDGRAVLQPARKAALDALEELRKAIEASGVTEQEFIESGEEIAKELFRRDYPALAAKYGI
jgi:AbrB family looped-hinge helix DNA binding protein